LQEIEEETDINQDRLNLKQVILEAAREFKSSKDAENSNHWWEDEGYRAIRDKNEERGKCLIRKARTNLDIYQRKKKLIESGGERKKSG
jgi:hypothetical protein